MNELNPIAFLQARSGKLWPPHDGTVVLHDDHPWVQLEDPEEVVQGGTGFTASRFAVYENADWLVHGDGLPICLELCRRWQSPAPVLLV